MSTRTVELMGFDADTSIPADKLHAAVGYLSMWNLDYPHVRIVFDVKNEELIASYWAAVPESVPGTRPGYVIGGIWHEDTQHFSFHS